MLSSAFPKYFTAGLDLKESSLERKGDDPARKALRIKKHVLGGLCFRPADISGRFLIAGCCEFLDLQRAITQIAECDKPVISAVSGIAYGLAVDICCACDIRYTSSDAIFSIKVDTLFYFSWQCTHSAIQEVDIGIAADIGTLSRLHRIIGNQSLARELAFTARPFSAKEALNLGFVSRIFEGGHQEVVGEYCCPNSGRQCYSTAHLHYPDAALATARVIACEYSTRLHREVGVHN